MMSVELSWELLPGNIGQSEPKAIQSIVRGNA